jgi:hypothetical protein
MISGVCSSQNVLPVTADNIKRLQDQYARTSPLSLEQRVIRWLQSIPMFVGESQHDPGADLYGGGGGNLAQMGQTSAGQQMDPTQRYYDPQDDPRGGQRASANNMISSDMGMDAALAAGGVRKDLSSLRRPTTRSPAAAGMPPGASAPKYPPGAPGMERGSSGVAGRDERSKASKGRLCCYLKVEVSGNTQMLPIHEVRFMPLVDFTLAILILTVLSFAFTRSSGAQSFLGSYLPGFPV